ncbi:MAG: hypothetical protein HC807_06850 [Gammaproteobacteria bacterium]|nr:hypothetical protein [Gammaproteobacteria bacterium]
MTYHASPSGREATPFALIEELAFLELSDRRRALAEFVLTTMEGGVMLARSYRDVGYFDRAVQQLRDHFNRLLHPAKAPARRRPQRRKKGKSHA